MSTREQRKMEKFGEHYGVVGPLNDPDISSALRSIYSQRSTNFLQRILVDPTSTERMKVIATEILGDRKAVNQ